MSRVSTCRACGALIIFLRTKAGKQAPVDAHSVEPTDVEFDPKKHATHFASCPKADEFRRRKR